MTKVCPYCGKKYYEVKNIPLWIPESDSQERNHQPGRSSFLYQESGNAGRCELLSNKRTDQKN